MERHFSAWAILGQHNGHHCSVLSFFGLGSGMVSDIQSVTLTEAKCCRFPYTTPTDAAGINYAPIIVAGVVLFSTIYYVAYSRKNYQNPAPDEGGSIAVSGS